jgi:hypothetical protein
MALHDDGARPSQDSKELNRFQVWEKYQGVAMHFNDLLMRLRSQSLAAVGVFATLAGVLAKEDIAADTRWGLMSAVFALLSAFWAAIWILDFGYYNRLLTGAVDALLELEALPPDSKLESLTLSTRIEEIVVGRREGPPRVSSKARRKTLWFYSIVLVALLTGLAVSVGNWRGWIGAQEPAARTPPPARGSQTLSCAGEETGKVKGWKATHTLVFECIDGKCTTRFGTQSFDVERDEEGRYVSLDVHYFEYDPATGEVQGVSGAPYYYFTGTCSPTT